MCAGDDDDLVDGCPTERFEYRRQELALLDAAIARRRACSEDDCR